MKHSCIRNFTLSAVLTCLPVFVAATPLNPGDMIPMPGNTLAAEPVLGGVVINDDVQHLLLGIPGAADIFAIGTDVQNRVFRSSIDGTLIFAPRILTAFNNTSTNFLVDRMGTTTALRYSS